MKEIITDLSLLNEAVEPLTFLSKDGVDNKEGLEIINELKEILTSNPNLVALSAPQIGIKKRVFCIKFADTIKTFINPIITKKSNVTVLPEICASMPGKEILIGRPSEVTVVYYNDEFKYEDNKLLDTAARIFDQQEQFLEGVTPADLGLVSDIEQDGSVFDLAEDEYAELIEIYKNFIKLKSEAYSKELSTDADLTNSYKNMKASEDVINGRVQIITEDKMAKTDKIIKKREEMARSKANFRNFVRSKK